LKLYDTLAEAISATNARNARSSHRTHGFWVAITADNGGFTIRWVDKARTRSRLRSPRCTPKNAREPFRE
jgi:hypothetical protein